MLGKFFIHSILPAIFGTYLHNHQKNIRKSMPKQVIISMEEKYPFGQCDQCTSENCRVLVREIVDVSFQQRKRLMEKVKLLKRIQNQHMIRIESVMEEDETIHFYYEYIPIKVEVWVSNINDEFIDKFKEQLISFSTCLANSNIRTTFSLKNIGLDHDYQVKYFLNLNFELSTLSKDKLKAIYHREISDLFQPYLKGNKSQRSNVSDQCLTGFGQSHKIMIRQEMGAEKKQNNKLDTSDKSKGSKGNALERYYQEANMSVDYHNEELLKEFINVLDDQEEQESQTFSDNLPLPRIGQYDTLSPRGSHQTTQKSSSFSKRDTTSISTSPHIVSLLQNPKLSFNDPPQLTQKIRFMKSCSIGRKAIDYVQSDKPSVQIQARVKTMIEKSKTIIRKFKEISNSSRR